MVVETEVSHWLTRVRVKTSVPTLFNIIETLFVFTFVYHMDHQIVEHINNEPRVFAKRFIITIRSKSRVLRL